MLTGSHSEHDTAQKYDSTSQHRSRRKNRKFPSLDSITSRIPKDQIWLTLFGHLDAAEAFPIKIRDKAKVEGGQIIVQINPQDIHAHDPGLLAV